MSGGEKTSVVDMWRALEFFTPQTFSDADAQGMFQVEPGRPLPWEVDPESPESPVPDQTVEPDPEAEPDEIVEYRVYLGVFDLENLFKVLNSVMEAPADAFYDPPVGESAIGSVVVSDKGELIPSSGVLSGCAWAAGRVERHRDPDWLEGFDEAQREFATWLSEAVADPASPAVCTVEMLVVLRDWIVDRLGIGGLDAEEIRVERTTHRARKPGKSDPPRSDSDFLNSFLVEDLRRVRDAVRSGDFGPALDAYLSVPTSEAVARRVNTRDRPDVVDDLAQPARVPLGRWPSDPAHRLATGQQVAVDAITAALGDSTGIFAVNGPPGTGKTTMLRDLIASVVVERASKLAGLARPEDAFVPGAERRWKDPDGYPRQVPTWRPGLAPEGIVVVSANNAAVENVSVEIVAADAVELTGDSDADDDVYFTDIATRLLRGPGNSTAGDRVAWALIAAKLGKRSNRGQFKSAFWFKPKGKADMAVSERANMQDQLSTWMRSPPMVWADEVARFRAAHDEAAAMRHDRQDAYVALSQLPGAHRDVETARLRTLEASASAEAAHQAWADYGPTVTGWQAERDRRAAARLEHLKFRPNLAQALLRRASAKVWHDRDDAQAAAVDEAERSLGAASQHVHHLVATAASARNEAELAGQALEEGSARLAELQQAVERATETLPEAFPDLTASDEAREIAAPWIDPAWNTARSGLFLAALRLHKAFLACAAGTMVRALRAAVDVVAGDAPADLDPATIEQAWNTLFFTVPVVSTTFASVGKMFPHLGRETLGWVLIDEAGQATPQQAAGAIWRARRVVCVGDPLQLEPVFTLPFYAQQTIRNRFEVDDRWLPERSSVQSLADEATPLGTYVRDMADRQWVGAPLRVHRRCDEPMFTISNQVAYDGLMVHAVHRPDQPTFPDTGEPLPDSTWYDVPTHHANSHWAPAEGERLDQLLQQLAEGGCDLAQVFVFSPFRAVAHELERRKRRYRKITAGTVHRSQGREADIVILVLGGDPDQPGAKRWAAAKPNLVNVAVSRARRRLYVIGDNSSWSQQPHFDVLAAHLPVTHGQTIGHP